MIEPYKPIYRVSEVAELLCTSKCVVYDMLKNGELPYLLINNGKRVRGSDLEKYVENHPVEQVKNIEQEVV